MTQQCPVVLASVPAIFHSTPPQALRLSSPRSLWAAAVESWVRTANHNNAVYYKLFVLIRQQLNSIVNIVRHIYM